MSAEDDESGEGRRSAPDKPGGDQPLPPTGGERKLRARHDGFSPSRQKKFLRALGKTGCVADACRRAGISTTSAYRARERLPELAEKWEMALKMASAELEAIAFKRATEGVEEK